MRAAQSTGGRDWAADMGWTARGADAVALVGATLGNAAPFVGAGIVAPAEAGNESAIETALNRGIRRRVIGFSRKRKLTVRLN
jgi:hypothetical protein